MLGALIGVGIAVIFVGISVCLIWRRIQQRDRDLGRWYGLGTWRSVAPEPQMLEWVRSIDPEGAGRHPIDAVGNRVSAALHGEHRGFAVFAVSWWWREVGGPSAPTGRQTVVAINLPSPTPALEIVHVKRDSSGLTLGWQPFDQQFRVTTDNQAFAHAVLSKPTMQWLLSDPRSQYFPVRFSGNAVSTWSPEELDPESLGPPADYLVELLTRLPHQVWR